MDFRNCWGFQLNGSDTGSRGSSPLNFAEKTGISLTFSQLQLTIRQNAQNFERLFFACLKEEFNPHFRAFFGTDWDKLASVRRGVSPRMTIHHRATNLITAAQADTSQENN